MCYNYPIVETTVGYAAQRIPQTIELTATTTQIENRDTFVSNAAMYRVEKITNGIIGLTWEERVTFARQAQESWSDKEGIGSSVEIVRRLRDEWE